MDDTTRWETEAIRSSQRTRQQPPRPSSKQPDEATHWVTLKEAETTTSIPISTLRKWARKSAVPSYLESDGDISLRMVDLDAVVEHARELGRDVARLPDDDAATTEGSADAAVEHSPTGPPEGTMIVPIQAWDKMLNQLGNLHEAGQQLAEARERAAKAETEASFLRERLAEIRAENTEHRTQNTERSQLTIRSSQTNQASGWPEEQDAQGDDRRESTTSYWRYLTFGWRNREKRE